MEAARRRGVRLGRPAASALAAGQRAAELRDQGLSLAQICAALNAEQVPTLSGRGIWAKSSVRHVLARFDSEQGESRPQ
jgi:hypothetical protein